MSTPTFYILLLYLNFIFSHMSTMTANDLICHAWKFLLWTASTLGCWGGLPPQGNATEKEFHFRNSMHFFWEEYITTNAVNL